MTSYASRAHGERRSLLNLFEPPLPEGHSRDPVCRMAVDPTTAEAKADYDGKTYFFCCEGCREQFLADPKRFVGQEPQATAQSARDPVCGMTVDPATAERMSELNGTTYYFCSSRCREKFVADPAQFIGADTSSAAAPTGGHAAYAHHDGGHDHGEAPSKAAVKDPVCGMNVDPATAKHKAEHDGATNYFCSSRCREKFVAEPTKYLAPQPAKPPEAAAGVMYTCPMHPQI